MLLKSLCREKLSIESITWKKQLKKDRVLKGFCFKVSLLKISVYTEVLYKKAKF